MIRHAKSLPDLLGLAALVALVMFLLLFAVAHPAHGAEIIPTFGLTKPADGNADGTLYGGVALRGQLMPFLADEIAIAYHSETRFDGVLKLRQVPVTASLWVTPVPFFYAGGGVGFYNTTYDYDQSVLGSAVPDETKQLFGVHLGGGMRVPLAPVAALDLNGRYVMMRDQQSHLVPEQFNPDYWTATLGLAFRF
jgi:hypothetical protein